MEWLEELNQGKYKSMHIEYPSNETFLLLASRGRLYILNNLDLVKVGSFLAVNPKNFSEETPQAHLKGFIRKLYFCIL